MRKQFNKVLMRLFARIGLVIVLVLVVAFLIYSNYQSRESTRVTLKSRYTFNVRIDEEGNVLAAHEESSSEREYQDFSGLDIGEIADIWIREFTGQFMQSYVPRTKALRKVKYDASEVLDEDTNTVLVSFAAVLKDSSSEYFTSWDGVVDNGWVYYEWVISYALDNHYDGTATVYVSEIMSPEDYGIARYNESLTSKVETVDSSSGNALFGYEIRDNTLLVTYDKGEKYITVPVDCANLPMESNSTTQLLEGSYNIDVNKTAFLYGGKTSGNDRTPVMLVYSNDKGSSWITCEIESIYDASYYYVDFFDENTGIIVIGYNKNGNQQSSRIYETVNGGETWNAIGSGPALNVIKGVMYIDQTIGFFCYDYVDGMDSNLYMTRDGGQTFSKVTLEEQELDSTAANAQTSAVNETSQSAESKNEEETTTPARLTWKDVYKEALVPVYDDEGVLTVYLTQGSNGVYNSGKTAAKYQSSDKGVTWKYIGQLEISS